MDRFWWFGVKGSQPSEDLKAAVKDRYGNVPWRDGSYDVRGADGQYGTVGLQEVIDVSHRPPRRYEVSDLRESRDDSSYSWDESYGDRLPQEYVAPNGTSLRILYRESAQRRIEEENRRGFQIAAWWAERMRDVPVRFTPSPGELALNPEMLSAWSPIYLLNQTFYARETEEPEYRDGSSFSRVPVTLVARTYAVDVVVLVSRVDSSGMEMMFHGRNTRRYGSPLGNREFIFGALIHCSRAAIREVYEQCVGEGLLSDSAIDRILLLGSGGLTTQPLPGLPDGLYWDGEWSTEARNGEVRLRLRFRR